MSRVWQYWYAVRHASHFSSLGFPYPTSFAKITLLYVLLRFLGFVNSLAPHDIVGVDNFHNMGSRLPYLNDKGFATLACPNWAFKTMTLGGFKDDEILTSRLTMARTPFNLSNFAELQAGNPGIRCKNA